MRKLIVAVLSLLAVAPAVAAEVDPQLWSQFVFQGTLAGPVKGYLEVQPRYSATAGRLERFIARPALGVELIKDLTFWAGYAWNPGFSPGFQNEDRLYQQLTYQPKIGSLTLQSRTRFEQRFVQGVTDTSLRLRELVRLAYDVAPEGQWQAVVWDELFLNTNTVSAGTASGFDQNRVFLGVNRKLSEIAKMDLGYFGVYVDRPNRTEGRTIHGVMVVLYFNP